LFKRGVEVYEYHNTVLHGKISTYDGKWVTAGSYNVNNISAYASIELNLDIADETFAQETEKKLLAILSNESAMITEEYYRTSFNFFQRFIQWVSYNIVRFLFYIFTFYFKQR
jgi:cardiolipin synthase